MYRGLGTGGRQGPPHAKGPQALALGERTHPSGPPAVPSLFPPLEPHPVLESVRHARLARHRYRGAAPLRQDSSQHGEGEALLEVTGCGRPGPGAAPGPGGGARVGPEVLRHLLPELRPGGPPPAGARHRGGLARPDEAGPVLDGPKPSDELTHYRTHLTKPAEGEVLVQEGKNKSAAWRMPTQLYLHWVAHFLVADTVHWRRVDCSVQEVNALYNHLYRSVLPRRFAYMASAHRWAGFGLNYMYMNLKAKCFAHLQGRTCQKPGHSCLHKVVSWCSHPAVDYYRWLARGAQTLVAAWGRGHDSSSIKTAAAELKSKIAALSGPAVGGGAGAEGQAPGAVLCAKCKAHTPCPAALVADAAHMYEEVPPSRVRHGLRSLITWATSRGYTGVAVSKRTAGPSSSERSGATRPAPSCLPGMSSARAWTWPSPRARSPLVTPSGSKRRDFLSEDHIARPTAARSRGPTRPPGPTTRRLAPGTAACRRDAASRSKLRWLGTSTTSSWSPEY